MIIKVVIAFQAGYKNSQLPGWHDRSALLWTSSRISTSPLHSKQIFVQTRVQHSGIIAIVLSSSGMVADSNRCRLAKLFSAKSAVSAD